MPALIVTYASEDGARFDRDYYDNHHMALAQEIWGPHGLASKDVFYPKDADQPFACICVLRFADAAGMEAAIADPRTPDLMNDVANFTDIVPQNAAMA